MAKDEQKACEWYLKAAEQGHVGGQFLLGIRHATGIGVARDEEKAFWWYLKAAEQGDCEAQFRVGLRLSTGVVGVAKDEEKACEWYVKAAEQGHVEAQFNMGVRYECGRGVAKDEKKAREWYLKAAEKGMGMAWIALEMLERNNNALKCLLYEPKEIGWEEVEVVGAVVGSVLKGRWKSRDVAVKVLDVKGVSSGMEELKDEAKRLGSVICAHVAVMHGFVYTEEHAALVMEWAFPDLKQLLGEMTSPFDFPWSQRWTVAKQVAMGMRAIHEAGILHYELRAANVWMGDKANRVARICDFGSLVVVVQERSKEKMSGKSFWRAPECKSVAEYSKACDVFSFGVLMFEIATLGEVPFAGLCDDEVVAAYVDGKRGRFGGDVPEAFKQVVEGCWDGEPSKRPGFSEIVKVCLKYGEETLMI